MNTTKLILTLGALTALSGCLGLDPEVLGSSGDAIVCTSDQDCPIGLECEVEDDGSFCQVHGSGGGGDGSSVACDVDDDCPVGQECELEHGGSFCKPHGSGAGGSGAGSNSGSGAGGSGAGSSSGSGAGGSGAGSSSGSGAGGSGAGSSSTECVTDADCPAGEECEIQDQGSFCKPHGGQ